MIYKIISNGKKVLVTTSYEQAAKTYGEEICKAKGSLIIRMYRREKAEDEWILYLITIKEVEW